MRKFAYVFAAAALAALVAAPASAASSKFAAQLSRLSLIAETTDATVDVLTATIKTPNKHDLLIGVSLEGGLYTQTKVTGKNGGGGSATATAGIAVRVLVDGVEAEPGVVTFTMRMQKLSAVLGGVIESCDDADGDGAIDISDDCVVTDEEIELILRTLAAHHFNFVAIDLTPGVHTVVVEAAITTVTATDDVAGFDSLNTASAMALVGKGSVTVQQVRAINQEGGITVLA